MRGDKSCAAYVSVYTKSKGRSTASVRRTKDFIDIVVCYVSEPEYVDGNGTIWGSMVTCVEYIGEDGIDPFGYRFPGGGGGGGGGGLPLPCSISGNFTINALVSGSPTLQSILAAVAAKYGTPANFNVIQGVGPNGMNAESHYATHTIDFYTNHSGDGAQIIEHEGLHLYNEEKDPVTGIRPNPFPGDPAGNFQPQRIVSLTDGTQLTFNIAVDANGTMNAAYAGYDHFIIHDQLIQLDGVDSTSALAQAFYQADSVKLPGGIDHKMTPEEAKAAASTRTTTGSATPVPPPPPPAPLDGCNTTLSVTRSAQSTVRHIHALDHVDGYYINWDGEITL